MVDPTLQTALCGALEQAINTALRFDPGSRALLADIQGQVMAVSITKPDLTVYLVPVSDRLDLRSQYEYEVTTRLQGSPLALAKLAASDRYSLADSGVEVYGSTGLLVSWQQLINQLEIDWEDALSQALGDVGGHTAAQGLRYVFAWANGRHGSLQRLLGEYLTEELRATPSRHELEDYYQQVNELSLAGDRLAARIARLQQQENEENRH